MKKLIIVSTLLMRLSLSAQTYWLEQMMDRATQYPAPLALRTAMRMMAYKDLEDCRQDDHDTDLSEPLFCSVEILVAEDRRIHLLVPTRYLHTIFGAHAIPYWIVLESPKNSFMLLYRGGEDAIRILPTRTHGYSDIQTIYGPYRELLAFDGHEYH